MTILEQRADGWFDDFCDDYALVGGAVRPDQPGRFCWPGSAFLQYGVDLILFVIAGAGDGPLLSATLQVRAANSPPEARAQVFTTGAALKLSAAAAGAALTGLAAGLPAPLLLAAIAATQLGGAAVLWMVAASGRHGPARTEAPALVE